MKSSQTTKRRESTEVKDLREIVGQLRAEGRIDEAFEQSFSAVQSVLDYVKTLQLKLLSLQKKAVGKTSERMTSEQLELLFEQMQTLQDLAELDEGEANALEEKRKDAALQHELTQAREQDKQQARDEQESSQRGPDTSGADRRQEVSTLSEAERTDPKTGRIASLIGYDQVQTLEYEPGRFILKTTKVAKYGFGGTGKGGVLSAPSPSKVISRGLPGASLLADLIVAKHVDHLPLNRLAQRYERAGVAIPPSTMVDWIAAAGRVLEPLAQRIFERVRQAEVVRIDASGIKVLDPQDAENIIRGTMWCMVGDDRDVAFRYAPTGEGAEGPWSYLSGREGYIQADAANIFDRLFNGQAASAIEVGCNVHARRNFVRLAALDSRVARPLRYYNHLFKLEELARLYGLEGDALREFRQERSRPMVQKLQRWLVRHANDDPPDTAFSKAIAYAVNHHQALARFLDDGRLDIDNNLCERQIRALALGRKNFLFAGSHEAAKRLAIGYTMTRTCALHDVPPWEYLTGVIERLADGWPQRRIDELLPDRWDDLRRG